MPRITFNANLLRHVPCVPADLSGATVREILDSYFARNPGARGYVLDEQGALRKHIVSGIPPSVFGFAVAVHPADGQTAWFVPAISDEKRIPVEGRVVVTHTRDGGKSFDVLREGLPQEHAYDLTLRHALDMDGSGTCLAFGSTTGSAWVSNDQGDLWQTLSAHLPPVYCVRFGA